MHLCSGFFLNPFSSQWTFELFSSFGSGLGFPGSSDDKVSACSAGDLGSIPLSGGSSEKEMATHYSIFIWKIQWTEEPSGL